MKIDYMSRGFCPTASTARDRAWATDIDRECGPHPR